MKLYHATYNKYRKSIEENGLIPNFNRSNYDLNETGCLYFAFDPDVAISYAECSENPDISEDDLDNIIICEVDSGSLDISNVGYDSNNRTDNPEYINSLSYSARIAPENLKIYTEREIEQQADIQKYSFSCLKNADDVGATMIYDKLNREFENLHDQRKTDNTIGRKDRIMRDIKSYDDTMVKALPDICSVMSEVTSHMELSSLDCDIYRSIYTGRKEKAVSGHILYDYLIRKEHTGEKVDKGVIESDFTLSNEEGFEFTNPEMGCDLISADLLIKASDDLSEIYAL